MMIVNDKIKAYYVADDIDDVLNYIDNLEQENQRLKDKIDKAINFVDKYMEEWDFQDEVRKDMNDLLILLKEN